MAGKEIRAYKVFLLGSGGSLFYPYVKTSGIKRNCEDWQVAKSALQLMFEGFHPDFARYWPSGPERGFHTFMGERDAQRWGDYMSRGGNSFPHIAVPVLIDDVTHRGMNSHGHECWVSLRYKLDLSEKP
jgi:hypothetical protein